MVDLRQGPLAQWTWDFETTVRPHHSSDGSDHCGCAAEHKCFKSILRSINGVKPLTICRWLFEQTMCKNLYSSSGDPKFYFCRLKELWWIDCSIVRHNINALLCFLKLCPNLERLSHRQYNNNSVDEEARATIKHQNLLHDFLELQKEFVSKKNLETINQMRGTLLNEIRFLRQRYNYLSMIKSQEYELQQDSVQSQNPYPQSKRTKKHGVSESIERRLSSLPDSYPNVVINIKYIALELVVPFKCRHIRILLKFISKPLFRENNSVIISKLDGKCWKHLVKVAKLEKKGKYPYKFKMVENVDERFADHIHMNLLSLFGLNKVTFM